MLSDHPVYATIPTRDLAPLRRFYEDVLGFPIREETQAGIFYQAGEGTHFAITRSSGSASGSHTQMGFAIRNNRGRGSGAPRPRRHLRGV
jgi:catechol 2,3-dioxygenase-like lactoylglutathione lyase family enzyme